MKLRYEKKKYSNSCLQKIKICYHRCIKLFFGFSRMYSVTAILFDLGLPSFDTIMHNCRAVYKTQVDKCMNVIIRHLNVSKQASKQASKQVSK